MKFLPLVLSAILVVPFVGASADEGQLKTVEKLPSELSEKIVANLDPAGTQVVVGDEPVVTVWLVKSLAIKPDFKPSLSVKYPFAVGQLVGAIKVEKSSDYTDFRGQELKPGVYTLRYGQQPVDGNHVGTSETYDFLLAIPAKADTDPAPVKTPDAVNKLSAPATGSNHPAIYFLSPPAEGTDAAKLTHNEDFDWWILTVIGEGKAGDAAVKVPLVIVVSGMTAG